MSLKKLGTDRRCRHARSRAGLPSQGLFYPVISHFPINNPVTMTDCSMTRLLCHWDSAPDALPSVLYRSFPVGVSGSPQVSSGGPAFGQTHSGRDGEGPSLCGPRKIHLALLVLRPAKKKEERGNVRGAGCFLRSGCFIWFRVALTKHLRPGAL